MCLIQVQVPRALISRCGPGACYPWAGQPLSKGLTLPRPTLASWPAGPKPEAEHPREGQFERPGPRRALPAGEDRRGSTYWAGRRAGEWPAPASAAAAGARVHAQDAAAVQV